MRDISCRRPRSIGGDLKGCQKLASVFGVVRVVDKVGAVDCLDVSIADVGLVEVKTRGF